MTARFRPLQMSDDEWNDMQTLQDGVGPRLAKPLASWLVDELTGQSPYTDGGWMKAEFGHQIEAILQIDLMTPVQGEMHSNDVYSALTKLQDFEILRLTDYLASLHEEIWELSSLDLMLDRASSKWQVHHNGERWGLAERVPEGSQMAVEQAIADDTSSGKLLARAWRAAYGITPDAAQAYSLCVRAVEVAVCAKVEPLREPTKRTLGTAAREISQQPSWSLPLHNYKGHEANHDAILRLMQVVWEGQKSRHADGRVDIAQARAAIFAASTLIAWFEGGYAAKSI